AAAQAHELISADTVDDTGGADVVGLLDAARRQLERVAGHDSSLAPIAESVANASFVVSDLAVQLSSYLSGLDADSGRELELVQERRAELAALARKHGPTIDDAIELLDGGSRRLLELDNDSDRIELLRSQVESDRAMIIELGEQVSGIRRSFAAQLGDQVPAALAQLAMPGSRRDL